jgi:hypothetical protein
MNRAKRRELRRACLRERDSGILTFEVACNAKHDDSLDERDVNIPWTAIQLPLVAKIHSSDPEAVWVCLQASLQKYANIFPKVGNDLTIPALVVVATCSIALVALYFHIGNTLIPLNTTAGMLMTRTCHDLDVRRRHIDTIIAVQLLTVIFIALLMLVDSIWCVDLLDVGTLVLAAEFPRAARYIGPFSNRGLLQEKSLFAWVLCALIICNLLVMHIARGFGDFFKKQKNAAAAVLVSLLRTQLFCDMVVSATVVYVPYICSGMPLLASFAVIVGYRNVIWATTLSKTLCVRLIINDMAVLVDCAPEKDDRAIVNYGLFILVLLENYCFGLLVQVSIATPLFEGFAPIYGNDCYNLLLFMAATRAFANIVSESTFAAKVKSTNVTSSKRQ